ncbi:hypothetical protein Kfla_6604 [Kribbella flavida DSM 17836]|uniref:Uncharacterized protein n=1 Tax=Kribbella flavida (strain DSM 17836 / JCM 10339 / NBRC 14399) TaxID=479435 RepID=D2PZN0_KRIFD|nr:hypothetical protein [Kribbella flavida]ADB35596.1 hypothetical protein Kfla_6604 [Kribbella flavida DSM 17836]
MMTSLLAATLLSTTLTAPPSVLAADVRLAWTTDGKVRISWSETSAAPNTVSLERDGADDLLLGSPSAAQLNELVLEPAALEPSTAGTSAARIVVSEPSGDIARSAYFDRYQRDRVVPRISYLANGDLAWSVPPDQVTDTTPNDPLDSAKPTTYGLRLMSGEQPWAYDRCRIEYTTPSTAPNGVLSKQRAMEIRTLAYNEWGTAELDWRLIGSSSVALNASSTSPYGATTTLTGKVGARAIYENPKPPGDVPPICFDADGGVRANTAITLQARNSATGPWYAVGPGKTDAAGNYKFSLRTPGTREYRVTVGGTSSMQPATSPARTVRSSTRVVSARFIQPAVKVGTQPQAYLWVDPAGTQKAALQFKNASGAWQGLTSKTLYAGRGLVAFPWNIRGTFQFRWWIPGSTTPTGLRVEPAYSGVFSLTVS